VTMSSQAVKFGLRTLSILALARLLQPEDFGLIAMVSAFTGFAAVFKDLGLSMATIQRDRINHDQVSTLFWINVCFSVLLTVITMAFAPVMAWIYGEPRLSAVTMVIGGTFIFSGLSSQHISLLQRQMKFTHLALIEIASMFAGLITGVLLAWKGCGYWALVGQIVIIAAVSMVLAWLLSRWRPGWPRRDGDVRSMLIFGSNLTGFNILNYFSRNADNALIGWYWGASQLGFYNRAYALMTLPLTQLRAPIAGVVTPGLSRLQHSPERYKNYYSHALRLYSLLALPIMTFIVITADHIVPIVLGPGWTETVSIFRWLAVAGLLETIIVGAGWIFVSQGRTGDLFRAGLASSSIAVCSFAAGLPWGPIGVAAVYSATRFLFAIPIIILITGRSGPISWLEVIKPTFIACKLSVLIACIVVCIRFVLVGYNSLLIFLLSATVAISFSLLNIWYYYHHMFPFLNAGNLKNRKGKTSNP